ncbi:hypothetical protein Pyn_10825 [Prunus yedoensis var. nudiflora]|uniref:Uncharacterized protein n=1 Tax=Prunus yedoensis var. nudiflora TaxID=2094558 RepID=A0A314XPM2_PRUYE|nr:hypothetical protein Pyn_10825 [Prunus yedoensis var. nudiflora]
MLEVANAELEEAKRSKETTEQDLKGYEVELAMNEATIQTLEALIESSMQSRISLTQDEISTVGSVLDALKNQKGASRFVSEEDPKLVKEEVTEGALGTLEDMLAGVISQTTQVEEECRSEQNIQKREGNMKMTELSGTSASAGPAVADILFNIA